MEMQVSGVNMHYELAGTGEKRVVLLHGWGCSTKLMRPLVGSYTPVMQLKAVVLFGIGKHTLEPGATGCLFLFGRLFRFLDFTDGIIQHGFTPLSVVVIVNYTKHVGFGQ